MVRTLVALALAASVAQAAPAVPQIADVPGSIERLLGDRGLAFERHDAALLERTLRPGDFAKRQLAWHANAKDVRFARFSLRVSTQFSGDLVSPRIRRRYPGLEVAVWDVMERTAFEGVETEPYIDEGAYTFVRERADPADRYDGWRHASLSDFEEMGFFSAVHLWDTGPVAVERSENFLLLTHPRLLDEVRPVLQTAEDALAIVKKQWPRPVRDKYAILVPTDGQELDRLLHPTIDLRQVVALVASGVDRETGFDLAWPRMFVNLDRFRRYDAAGRRGVVGHELVHAVSRPLAGAFVPTWVEEGFANSLGDPDADYLPFARSGPAPVDFPGDEEFVAGSVTEIGRAYARGTVAVDVFREQRGTGALLRFYEALGSARVAPGTPSYHVARAVEAAGWSLDEWRTAWLREVR